MSDYESSVVDELVRPVAARLLHRGWTCATAESCTGGWIAQVLTAMPGSSAWFDCGFVTYSNQSKRNLLGVDAALLDRLGAVSEEVARAMAAGAVDRSCAQAAVSVTGIAGPDGGSAEKPVGTVAFGWMLRGRGGADSEVLTFEGDRRTVRCSAVVHALKGLLARIA